MKYAWSAPEVMQISQMDCGPSCLKSVLQGFHIPVHFGHLREACQTGVDGTSVNTIEELACELGLAAQQVLVPLNHLHLPEAEVAPSILITQLPNNLTHFIVVWRSLGAWVQIMDPSHGTHWLRWEALKQKVYLHRMSLSKKVWEAWADSDEYRLALTRRLNDLGFTADAIQKQFALSFQDTDSVIDEDTTTKNWLEIASLDAAITWTESLLQARALKKGHEAVTFLQAQYTRAVATSQPWVNMIPAQYWWAVQDEQDADSLQVKAAVVVRIAGLAEQNSSAEITEKKLTHARINDSEPGPWATLSRILLPQQHKLAVWLIPIIILAAVSVTLQALLFQGLLGMSSLLGQHEFNFFIPMVFVFIALSSLMELPIAQLSLTLGRQLESQFRIALFNKLPKIHDPYFRSRLLTEMARRSHRLYILRSMPGFAVTILQQLSLVVFTLIGILWLDFFAGLVACVLVGLLLSASIVWQKTLRDAMARAETQAGIISMLYFDTLKGLRAIRSHAAQTTFENEQEIQLSRWGAAHYNHKRKQTGALLLLDLVALCSIAALMLGKILFNANAGLAITAPSLLWFYWILRLPYLVKHLSLLIMDLPHYGITLSLYTELLEATEVEQAFTHHHRLTQSDQINRAPNQLQDAATDCKENKAIHLGVAVEFSDVSLNVAGHSVLQDINIHIAAGQHIAIVGESGAGKSSICELLLGWQLPTQGQISVDGKDLQGETLLQLRQQTAWVDANVQLWDKSLLENLNYDHANGKVSDAGLGELLAGLANGLQTPLGECGKRLSGGEGQRVRIARAMGVITPRLVILDEPCRGLDRTAREQLLQKIRVIHADATLICITHDISEASKFSHVIVVDQGRVLEQGNPQVLLAQSGSAFSRLRNCEQQVLQSLLQDQCWQQLHLVNGHLQRGAVVAGQQVVAAPIILEEAANA